MKRFLFLFPFLLVPLILDFLILKEGGLWLHRHGVFALIGFIGSFGIIFCARALGRLIERREDYYD